MEDPGAANAAAGPSTAPCVEPVDKPRGRKRTRTNVCLPFNMLSFVVCERVRLAAPRSPCCDFGAEQEPACALANAAYACDQEHVWREPVHIG